MDSLSKCRGPCAVSCLLWEEMRYTSSAADEFQLTTQGPSVEPPVETGGSRACSLDLQRAQNGKDGQSDSCWSRVLNGLEYRPKIKETCHSCLFPFENSRIGQRQSTLTTIYEKKI